MTLNILLLFIGIATLYFGSEWMVRGAFSLALSFSIRPAIVGLTVVAFATSAPELLVSLLAAVRGSSGMSLGNILGSNVANMGLVLGISALGEPLAVETRLVRREIPFMIGVSGLFWLMCLDGRIGRWDGIVLLSALVLFLILGILTANKSNKPRQGTSGIAEKRTIKYAILILVGTAGLIVGARLMVDSAVFIARQLGFSEVFIGISILAVGTSLPELATSVLAGIKGEHDISIGNVVGSNIFNICLVIGFIGLFNPLSVDMRLIWFEFPAMFLLCLLLLLICRIKYAVNRLAGFSFVLYFFAFLAMSYWRG